MESSNRMNILSPSKKISRTFSPNWNGPKTTTPNAKKFQKTHANWQRKFFRVNQSTSISINSYASIQKNNNHTINDDEKNFFNIIYAACSSLRLPNRRGKV